MTYPASASTFEELVAIARRVIDRQSNNMVADAIVLARWVLAEDERGREAMKKAAEEIYRIASETHG